MTYCVVTPAATKDPEGFKQWCKDRCLILQILRTPMITLQDQADTDLDALIEAGWVARICGLTLTPAVIACMEAGQDD